MKWAEGVRRLKGKNSHEPPGLHNSRIFFLSSVPCNYLEAFISVSVSVVSGCQVVVRTGAFVGNLRKPETYHWSTVSEWRRWAYYFIFRLISTNHEASEERPDFHAHFHYPKQRLVQLKRGRSEWVSCGLECWSRVESRGKAREKVGGTSWPTLLSPSLACARVGRGRNIESPQNSRSSPFPVFLIIIILKLLEIRK